MLEAFGRTLRRHGGLRLVAVPAGEGTDHFFVTDDGAGILGEFAELGAAATRFEALRQHAVERVAAPPTAPAGAGAVPAAVPLPDNVTDLAEYRRTRRR